MITVQHKMTSNLRKASLRETLSIAHTAECKLRLAVDRPDRELRFMLGHALTLDNVSLRLVEIEQEAATVQQPSHASGVKFQAATNGCTRRRTSPPPNRLAELHASDEEDEEDEEDKDDYFSSDDDQDELSLTRFPSGSARPPQEPPALISSEDDSSEEEDPPSPELPSEDMLRDLTKSDVDEDLMNAYTGVSKCPCHGHHVNAPRISRMWELPPKAGEHRADGVRFAVAEVAA